MSIIETNNYKVTKNSSFNFNIQIKGAHNDKILKSLSKTRILNNSFIDNDSMHFTAERIETLKDFLLKQPNTKLTNIGCIKLLKTITKQIKYLESINATFYGLNIEDILVIDEINYIIVSGEYILPIQDNNISFYNPFSRPYFSSPEILKLTNLPSNIDYRCCYYSLGALLVFCILNTNLLVGNEIKSDKDIEILLVPIYDTNVYWFLKRCLNSDILKRILLLV